MPPDQRADLPQSDLSARRATALYLVLERFILTRAVDLIREAYMPQPHESFRGLVADLRAQVTQATAKARALKGRGETSMAAFREASSGLVGLIDEVDAATAEINGVLLGESGNGGPAMDDLGNLPVVSAPSVQAGAGARSVESLITITAPTPVR